MFKMECYVQLTISRTIKIITNFDIYKLIWFQTTTFYSCFNYDKPNYIHIQK